MPASRWAVTAINKTVRGGVTVHASESTTSQRLYSRVALAVDRGVLYLYGFDVGKGATARLRRGGPLSQRMSAACEVYRPPRRGILRNRSAIGWFYLLGLIEPVLRGFVHLADVEMPAPPSHPTPLSSAAWLETLVPEDAAREIADLLRAVRDTRLPGAFRANPGFGGLGAVSGSDGDWLSGDTLVELKCTIGGIKREHVAQLLCYYAFDQLCAHGRDEPYGFSRLALCLPRHSCMVEGSVSDWLTAFGGPDIGHLPAFVDRWCTSR